MKSYPTAVSGKKILIIFALIILVPIGACYGTALFYTIVWGESIALGELPPKPNSILIQTEYQWTGAYMNRTDIYLVEGNIQELRAWYHHHSANMSPFDGILHDEDNAYHSLNHLGWYLSDNYLTLMLAANITYSFNPDFGAYEIFPMCFDVQLFTKDAIAESEYFNVLALSEADLQKVLAVVKVCWPKR